MTAPDKVWVDTFSKTDVGPTWLTKPVWASTEYTRDDIVDALRSELAATRMREAALLNGNQEDRDTLRRVLSIHDAQLTKARAETAAAYEVADAARILLNDRAAFQTMVDVGEEIHGTGVSFNRVFGDALNALIGDAND